MSAEDPKISASLSRLNDIELLQGVSNYQIWRRQFEDELTLLGMWHYIEDDYVAPIGATAAELKSWQQAHKRICTMLKSRCDENARSMIEDETNAHDAWTALEQNKPRGSGILNSTIRKFESITLSGCNDDPQGYANLFKKVSREFRVLSTDFMFNQNWLIYHFHSGLGAVYSSYCEQYDQNHDPFDDDGKPKFTLDYAITRFINTVTNPTNATSSVETKALAALVNGTFAPTPTLSRNSRGLLVSSRMTLFHMDMRYGIYGMRETCICQEQYLYEQHTNTRLFIRILLFRA